jgi:glucoamylase
MAKPILLSVVDDADGVSRPQWSRESSGSLGRGPRLFAIHHRRRNLRAPRRRRSGRRDRKCDGYVPIKNRPPGQSTGRGALMVSPDALALVRMGLRAADDPRMMNTVTVIDAALKVDTPFGPAWHRYQGDGYGEHADGRPFDGTGIGRAWPLLTGERAHYEIAAGRTGVAELLAHALEAFAGGSGLLPEQPPQTVRRYLVDNTTSHRITWRFNNKVRAMPVGAALRIETLASAVVHWSIDGWWTVHDTPTRDTTLGVHIVDLPTTQLRVGAGVDLTFFWPDENRWEGVDFLVSVE